MTKADKVMERVMKEANSLCKSKKEIATFTSSDTGQLFSVITSEQLRILGIHTSNVHKAHSEDSE